MFIGLHYTRWTFHQITNIVIQKNGLLLSSCQHVNSPLIVPYFSVVMGMILGYGLCSLFGLFYSAAHTVIPFLLLGIGIDNIFVITQTFNTLGKVCYSNTFQTTKKIVLGTLFLRYIPPIIKLLAWTPLIITFYQNLPLLPLHYINIAPFSL